MNVFELMAVLKLNKDSYDRGLSEAEKSGTSFGSKIANGIGTATKAIGAAVATAGAAMVALTKSSVQTGMEFDQGMSQVAATLGLTTDDIKNNINGAGETFDKLRTKAKEMGATTNFTATQAAEGLNILAMSGYDAEQSMSMIEDVLHLSAAGAMEMGEAAGYVAGAMKGFNDGTKDSGYYADLMAKGATLANTSVSQLGAAMSDGAATAAAYNQTADSMTVSLLRLAEQGEVGSAAGTALAAAMKNLYTPTDQAKAALDELGVAAYDESGAARDFNDVVNDLSAALSGMTDEEANAYKQTIFGIQGLNAYNKMTVTGTEKQNEWAKALAGASEGMGEAAKQYDTMTDNLQGDLDILSSSLDGLKIAISDGATPSIRDGVKGLSAMIDGVRGLVEGTKTGGQKIKQGFKQTMQAVMDGVPTVMSIFDNIIRGVGELLPEALEMLNDQLPGLFDTVFGMVENLIPGLARVLPSLVNTAVDLVAKLAGRLDKIIMPLVKALPGVITSAIQKIDSVLPGIMESIGNLAGQIISKLPEIVLSVVREIPGMILTAVKSIGGLFKGLFTGIFEGNAFEIDPEIKMKTDAAAKSLSDAREKIQGLMDGSNYSVDWSMDISSTGRTYDELEGVVSDAKENILRLLQELNDGSAEKREEDLENLAWYKEQMAIAYDEEEGILDAKIQATLGVLANGHDLTTEQYAAYVGRIDSWVQEEIDIINAEYDAQVEVAYAEAQTNGTRVEDLEATIAEIERNRQAELDGLQQYSTDAIGLMDDHNTATAEKLTQSLKDYMYYYGEQKAKLLDYVDENGDGYYEFELTTDQMKENLAKAWADLINNLDDDTKAAVATMWDMAYENAAAGKTIDDDTASSMATMLATVAAMPDDLHDQGKAMLKGLIEGTQFYQDELAKEWDDMTLAEIIEKVEDNLGITGTTSSVMEDIAGYTADGFINTLGDKQSEFGDSAEGIAQYWIDTFRDALKIKSPSRVMQENGEYTIQGLVNGINNRSRDVGSAGNDVVKGLLGAMENYYYRNQMYNIGYYLMVGLSQGIAYNSWMVADAAANAVYNAVYAAKRAGGIYSPSRVMRKEVGQMLAAGVAVGIDDGTDNIIGVIESQNAAMVDAYDTGIAYDATASGSGSSGRTGNGMVVNMTINAAPGQDAEEIADYAIEKLKQMINGEVLAYA